LSFSGGRSDLPCSRNARYFAIYQRRPITVSTHFPRGGIMRSGRSGLGSGVASLAALVALFCVPCSAEVLPAIVGPWWNVAGNPNVSPYTTSGQQPVDFAIWRDDSGMWRIWSCIRSTSYPGRTRLLHGWESPNLFATNWTPTGIEWTSETSLGEVEGGMQAPFVFEEDGVHQMFYGSWDNLARATSADGENFTRLIQSDNTTNLFPSTEHARDPMVLNIQGTYHLYYTEDIDGGGRAYVRTSTNLQDWSDAKLVAYGGSAGTDRLSAECPFVYYDEDSEAYYLFRTQKYGESARTSIYRSTDPTYFGVGDDADNYLVGRLPVAAPELFTHDGKLYMAALKPGLDGIRIAEIDFLDLPEASPLLASGGRWQVTERYMKLSAVGSYEIDSIVNAQSLLGLPASDPRIAFQREFESRSINFNHDVDEMGRFGIDTEFSNDTSLEHFAMRVTGTIRVVEAGDITFGISANDGARLRINGQQVLLDNSANKLEDTFGTIHLEAGQHQVELVYFQKRLGATIELLVANELGTFTSFFGAGAPPSAWSLLEAAPIAGDFNGDGQVDLSDYHRWRETFGSTTELAADGNFDGVVNLADYTIWRDSLQVAEADGLVQRALSIPEPGALSSTVSLLFLAVVGRGAIASCGHQTGP
jgi:hypothetical protein